MLKWIAAKVWCYVLNRLKEPSSWRGLIILLSLAGVKISPENQELIITAGVLLLGGTGVLAPDKVAEQKTCNPPNIEDTKVAP